MAISVKFRQNTITFIPFLKGENIRYLDPGVLKDELKNRIVIGEDRIIVSDRQPVFDIPVDFRNKKIGFAYVFGSDL